MACYVTWCTQHSKIVSPSKVGMWNKVVSVEGTLHFISRFDFKIYGQAKKTHVFVVVVNCSMILWLSFFRCVWEHSYARLVSGCSHVVVHWNVEVNWIWPKAVAIRVFLFSAQVQSAVWSAGDAPSSPQSRAVQLHQSETGDVWDSKTADWTEWTRCWSRTVNKGCGPLPLGWSPFSSRCCDFSGFPLLEPYDARGYEFAT